MNTVDVVRELPAPCDDICTLMHDLDAHRDRRLALARRGSMAKGAGAACARPAASSQGRANRMQAPS